MSFYKSWRRREDRESFRKTARRKGSRWSREKELLIFDFLYQLSYMSSIAAAGIPRDKIFEYAAQLPGRASKYFKDIHLAATKLGYDYAEACRLKGESVEDETIRSLLLRLAGSLRAGEAEADFLDREARVLAEEYSNQYERRLESMKHYTDAFTALIISSTVIIIVGLISTLIWQIGTNFVPLLVGLAIGAAITGAWLISLTAPKEVVTLDKPSSREQKLAHNLRFFLPLAVTVCGFLIIRKIDLGWIQLAAAAMLLPVGYVIISDDKKISKRDGEVGAFLRSLGGVATAIGTTVTEALGRIDFRSIPSLTKEAKKLRASLAAGIKPPFCWQRFVMETGSELVNRSVRMFNDAINLGGEPEEVGKRASFYATTIALLRAKRRLVSKPFSWLTFSMHGAVVALLAFITESVNKFGSLIEGVQKEIPGAVSSGPIVGRYFGFNISGLHSLHQAVIPVILVLTVVNALAPKLADGGHNYKIFYNLGITMGISGICLLAVPRLVELIFGSIG